MKKTLLLGAALAARREAEVACFTVKSPVAEGFRTENRG